MKLAEAVKVLKGNTMACWWPSRAFPGTNMREMLNEAGMALEGIRERQGIPAGESFYVLDDDDPETKLYDEIACAMSVFANAARS